MTAEIEQEYLQLLDQLEGEVDDHKAKALRMILNQYEQYKISYNDAMDEQQEFVGVFKEMEMKLASYEAADTEARIEKLKKESDQKGRQLQAALQDNTGLQEAIDKLEKETQEETTTLQERIEQLELNLSLAQQAKAAEPVIATPEPVAASDDK